jgi:hypothetical protein
VPEEILRFAYFVMKAYLRPFAKILLAMAGYEREIEPHFTAMSAATAWDMKRAVAITTTWSWHRGKEISR